MWQAITVHLYSAGWAKMAKVSKSPLTFEREPTDEAFARALKDSYSVYAPGGLTPSGGGSRRSPYHGLLCCSLLFATLMFVLMPLEA